MNAMSEVGVGEVDDEEATRLEWRRRRAGTLKYQYVPDYTDMDVLYQTQTQTQTQCQLLNQTEMVMQTRKPSPKVAVDTALGEWVSGLRQAWQCYTP